MPAINLGGKKYHGVGLSNEEIRGLHAAAIQKKAGPKRLRYFVHGPEPAGVGKGRLAYLKNMHDMAQREGQGVGKGEKKAVLQGRSPMRSTSLTANGARNCRWMCRRSGGDKG